MSRWFDLWHPSDRRLRTWLETDGPRGVSEHVERCERCADRLVDLDGELAALDSPSVGQALLALLSPPADLSQRVLEGVEARRRNDADLQLLAGLFSIGVETAQLMLSPADDSPIGEDGVEPSSARDESTAEPDQEDDAT